MVGGGSIGMRHIELTQTSEQTRLTAVVEPVEARRAELRDMGLPVVATLDEVPGDTRGAVVATPTPDHATSGASALARGMAVIVEKPVAGTLDDARTLVAAADRAGLPLFTGHHRRCHPFSLQAREALAQIGTLVAVQGCWSLRKHDSYYEAEWRRKPGAGPLMTNLSHEIDLLRFFVGEVEEVTALLSSAARGHEIEDTAALAFRFDSGALGSFLMSDAGASPWSFEAASNENPAIAGSGQDYLRLIGNEGALEFPSLTRWGRGAPGEIEWSKPLARTPGPELAAVDPLLAQVERFAAVVAGGSDDVLCTGADGIAALEMTLAAALSRHRGRPIRRGEVPGDYNGT
ncbi:oxidoreductase, Gfo/Idh/MocA family [Salipiger mucosus DSM 16094]|uniref:Oxidoreductase, Gfo/Idh/MocA family n=1 Tax=Salipiger mucosus DSM 16094 TaxID=1123237 RepID=S9QGG5_9RHOB|nr:oxidoreductase, Gfo/Idh/MocA family [Salipiger mucosus DSM 16094]